MNWTWLTLMSQQACYTSFKIQGGAMRKNISRVVMVILYFFTSTLFAAPPAEIYKKIESSVYRVLVIKKKTNENPEQLFTGSAVAISNNLLLTNCHVVTSNPDQIVIVNKTHYEAVLVDGDLKKDICILYARANLKPVRIKVLNNVEIGETVYALGSPGLHENLFTNGMIAGIETHPEKGKLIKFTAYLNHGSSGGGLFDSHGDLIGITTGSLDNVGFAVSLNWVKESLPYLQDSQEHNISMNEESHSQNNQEKKQIDNLNIFQLIGEYGEHKIALYKTDLGCIIKIPGRIHNGKTISNGFWFPQFPQAVFFFPQAENTDKTFSKLRQLRFADEKKIAYAPSKDFTLFFSKKIPLVYATPTEDSSNKLHFVVFNNTPLPQFLGGQYFITNFIAKNQLFYLPVYFGLYGFGEAYENYLRYCTEHPS
jgi:hypothetical protein